MITRRELVLLIDAILKGGAHYVNIVLVPDSYRFGVAE